jgi:hypothetical protein
METCKLCGKELGIEINKPCWLYLTDSGDEHVHPRCRDKAISVAIAARQAEKPKAPTLEERVEIEIHACADDADISRRIIAMVREHDGTTEWKDRAEKAEVVVVHYREQIAHRDGKIAVMKSQLEYLQDSIRVARDALNK